MSVLTVLTYPDPFLRRSMAPVADFDDTVRRIIADMTETMYAEPGVGLAATQVGIDRRVIVYDVSASDTPPQPQALVNPEIVAAEGSRCASLPRGFPPSSCSTRSTISTASCSSTASAGSSANSTSAGCPSS